MCTRGVCVSRCASATDMSPAVRLLSCFAPAPQVLQAMSLVPPAHHADFCLIHFKRLTCELNAANKPYGSSAHVGHGLVCDLPAFGLDSRLAQ